MAETIALLLIVIAALSWQLIALRRRHKALWQMHIEMTEQAIAIAVRERSTIQAMKEQVEELRVAAERHFGVPIVVQSSADFPEVPRG